jgi:hypothetical protein
MKPKGWRVDRTKRPLSRGMRAVVYDETRTMVGIAFSRQELAALYTGTPIIDVAMPGPRASIVRPQARYL